MVHVHETVRRVFKIGIYGFDAGGNGCKFYLVGTGYQGAASGHILCHMDGLGAVIMGIVLFREPATALRIFSVALLLTGILGLKMTSGH